MDRKLGTMRGAAVISLIRMRGLLGVLALLTLSLMFAAGCNLVSSGQDQALEEQKKKNEELQKQLDEKKKEETQQKKKEEEARQKKLAKKVEDLQKKVEEQEKEQDQAPGSSDTSSGDSSEGDIENSSISPSQANEGIVVVSSDFDTAAATAEEAEAINGAIDYYQFVEVGDYYSTYSLLSDADKNYYTEYEWVTANENLDSQAAEFVVTGASYNDVGTGYPTYLIDVSVYYTDGSVEYRQTNFTNEHGYWAHALTMDEMGLFDSALGR